MPVSFRRLHTSLKPLTVLSALALCVASPLAAGNGHFLHGVGAVNSALGGAGVALPNDSLGALHLNPALLSRLDGNRFQFSLELAEQNNAVESQIGPFRGRTEDDTDPANIPAFAWTIHRDGGRAAYGMGFLGLAGFAVDYPQDSSNPIFAPQPQGFGRLSSSYEFLKIPLAYSYQLSPQLSIGASWNVGRATLSGDPVGFAAPDCSGPQGPCFFPKVDRDGAYGYGFTAGIHWQLSDSFALGASHSTEMEFDEFEWNSAHANPALPNFGTARKISFQLDAPANTVVGLAWTPSSRFALAADYKLIEYSSAAGFGESGVNPQTGAVLGLGWEDINVIAVGAQFQLNERLTGRLGWNQSENPIPDAGTFFSLVAPGVFRDHYTGGVGLKVTDALTLDLTYYRATEADGEGPFLGATGPVPGSSVRQEISIDSMVATFSFKL